MISMDGFDCAGHPGEADIGNWVLFAKVTSHLKTVESEEKNSGADQSHAQSLPRQPGS